MTQQETEQPSKGGVGKAIAIGCGIVFVVAIIGVIVIFTTIKNTLEGYVENFTSAEAAQLADPAGTEGDAQTVIARFDAFIKALDKGEETEPLELDGNEINLLIVHHPKWKTMADKVRVTIEGAEIGGEVSIPLDELANLIKALKGRYLNGAATFTVGLTNGRLSIYLESLEVNGKAVPDQLMTSLSSENLAEQSNANPENRRQLEAIQSVAVKDGKLIIAPKPVADRPAPKATP